MVPPCMIPAQARRNAILFLCERQYSPRHQKVIQGVEIEARQDAQSRRPFRLPAPPYLPMAYLMAAPSIQSPRITAAHGDTASLDPLSPSSQEEL